MRRLKSLLRRVLVVTSLILSARALRLMRRNAAARRVLRRALALAPDSYPAHQILARIALADGSRTEAVRELRICARLDPERFHQLDIPESLGGFIDARFDPDSAPAAREPAAGPAAGMPGDPHAGPPARSDFSTGAEWERIRDLPPIDSEDIAAVDLDALLEQLVREPRPRRTRGT